MKTIKIALFSLISLSFTIANAQVGSYFDKFRPAKKWSAGVQISPTTFHGDADDTKIGFAFGGHIKYSVSQSFALKLNGNKGTLLGGRESQNISRNGKKHYNQDRPDGENVNDIGNQAPSEDSYSFQNNFTELNLTTVFTLGNISFLRPLRKLQMFGLTGFGAVWSDVTGQFDDQANIPSYAVGESATFHSYKGRNFVIPFGVGVKYNVNNMLDLGIEYRMNFTRSDNLDGFSYPVWRNRYADFYSIFGFQASFKFGSKENLEDHYDWLNPVESIYNTMDTLLEIAGKVELLLIDDDDDGVSNYYDKDPETEKDAWTWGNGIAADIDKDGVPDHRDNQPYSEKGSDVDVKGVMVDIDNDNVPDYRDDNTKTPAKALVDGAGNEINIAKIVSESATCCDCENVMLPAIVFDNGSSRIKPEYYGALYSVAEKMKQCPNLNVDATGYAYRSKSGSNLASKRIDAIVDYLNANYNIPRDRFESNNNGTGDADLPYKSRRIDLSKGK
jgi:outer membrane protein OmpA-like peptidoglycan-associated protein